MKLTVTRTPLDGVVFIDTEFFADERGFFMESWHQRDFARAGLTATFVQENHSRSTRGVIRGLHYQDMRAPLAKLVRCTVGSIFDVAVDLRVGSPSFGRWVSVELSAGNKRQILIPEGFAHGFQALSEAVEVQYKQTGFYTPEAEAVLIWNDPDIGIAWPVPDPAVSARDGRGMSLAAYREKPAFSYTAVSR